MISQQLHQALVDCLGPEGGVSERTQLRTYEMDALTGHRQVPGVVVLPESKEQVCAVVRLCRDAGVPIVPRGAGTGLSGGAMPREDGVLIVLSRMRRILAIDPEKAQRYRESSKPEHEDSCTMCGKMCAVRNMNRVHEGKDIQLND